MQEYDLEGSGIVQKCPEVSEGSSLFPHSAGP